MGVGTPFKLSVSIRSQNLRCFAKSRRFACTTCLAQIGKWQGEVYEPLGAKRYWNGFGGDGMMEMKHLVKDSWQNHEPISIESDLK